MALLLTADRVLTPTRELAPGWVLVQGERITALGPGRPPAEVTRPADLAPPSHLDPAGATIVPGYVDAHVHGGGGATFGLGGRAAARHVVRSHLARGTTTMVASLVSDSIERLRSVVAELAVPFDDASPADDVEPVGIHLEGPWLSPRYAGAHDPARLCPPDADQVETLVEAAAGRLRMVTLAPELPGGLNAVSRLAGHGVTVAIGHTDATYDQVRAAVEAGASVGTHLFNAMRPWHHREPGPVGALLDSPRVTVELVADGVHLHPAALRLAAGVDPEGFVLVTDAMAAAAGPAGDDRLYGASRGRDHGYRLGPLQVEIRDGVARVAGGGTIAGSTLTMAAAVRYAVRVAGLPLRDVVAAATSRPAAMLGLDGTVGTLSVGGQADLLVLDDDLEVRRVMRRGSWVA